MLKICSWKSSAAVWLQIFIWGGCDSVLTNWKVGGSIPGYSSLHGKVSLGNLLNPLLPVIYLSDCGTYVVYKYI